MITDPDDFQDIIDNFDPDKDKDKFYVYDDGENPPQAVYSKQTQGRKLQSSSVQTDFDLDEGWYFFNGEYFYYKIYEPNLQPNNGSGGNNLVPGYYFYLNDRTDSANPIKDLYHLSDAFYLYGVNFTDIKLEADSIYECVPVDIGRYNQYQLFKSDNNRDFDSLGNSEKYSISYLDNIFMEESYNNFPFNDMHFALDYDRVEEENTYHISDGYAITGEEIEEDEYLERPSKICYYDGTKIQYLKLVTQRDNDTREHELYGYNIVAADGVNNDIDEGLYYFDGERFFYLRKENNLTLNNVEDLPSDTFYYNSSSHKFFIIDEEVLYGSEEGANKYYTYSSEKNTFIMESNTRESLEKEFYIDLDRVTDGQYIFFGNKDYVVLEGDTAASAYGDLVCCIETEDIAIKPVVLENNNIYYDGENFYTAYPPTPNTKLLTYDILDETHKDNIDEGKAEIESNLVYPAGFYYSNNEELYYLDGDAPIQNKEKTDSIIPTTLSNVYTYNPYSKTWSLVGRDVLNVVTRDWRTELYFNSLYNYALGLEYDFRYQQELEVE